VSSDPSTASESGSQAKRKSALSRWAPIALAAILGITACALSFRYDAAVRDAIEASQGKKFKKTVQHQVLSGISRYGDWPQLMVLGGIGIGFATWRKRRDWIRVIAAAMIASTLAGVVANSSRLTTGRPRPRDEAKVGAGWYGPWKDGKILIGNPSYNAFPSGHTATAFGFAVVFLLARPVLGVVIVALAGTIAYSRMALGAHHFSDVIVSVVLSSVVAVVCLRMVERHGDEWTQTVRAWWKRHCGTAADT